MNPRITKKERGLLKGSIRRVFSRSELRLAVLRAFEVEHVDAKRPRVKKWTWCNSCGEVFPRYLASIDHVAPIVPVDSALENMSWDDLINAVFCVSVNLQTLCPNCHNIKTKAENKLRREHKKKRDKNERQTD